MEAGSATAAPCPQVDPHPLPHNQIGGAPSLEVAVAVAAAAAAAAAAVPPYLGDSDVPRSIQKTHPTHLFCPDAPFSKSSLKVAIG